MASMDLIIGMMFLFQIVIGILGNFPLLYHYMSLYFRGCRSRPMDLILRHLTIANSLVILSRGVPEAMAAFGLKQFMNDFGHKVLLYVHRVGRGVSIDTTCLLSVFQVITINPMNSRWSEIKVKAQKYTGPSSILCWVLHMLVNIIFPIYMTGKWSNKNITKKNYFGYYSASLHDTVIGSVYAALTSFHDVLCLGLMLWASNSMVFILYKHKQRVQHIHRNNLSPRSSPETRATQSILVLLSTFVSFYALSFIIYVCLAVFDNLIWWLVNTGALITACFPTISPFVLMCRDPRISRLCCVCHGRKTQFPHLIRKI
ncbi:PREDICTED: vomeronasal type-1 receptor 2 [Galeopterus variegatus]|uniref:Vomeronasal type-1 receptor n=1 Tax=Galeopterus variegatus TaxID=482537 RepID=A0ABM0R0T5_GALVR|nr:PREDICTED: vomeronasal type-1 receptor 2 [Galeopterus variegatus]